MIPLYHLRFDPNLPATSTEPCLTNLALDGIEGYVCTFRAPESSCIPADAQRPDRLNAGLDGFESLIGTSPLVADSDCDGRSDSDELLVYSAGGHDDPRRGPCDLAIFQDGFESGNLSQWHPQP